MYNLISNYEHEELTGLMEAIQTNANSHEREISENDSPCAEWKMKDKSIRTSVTGIVAGFFLSIPLHRIITK